MTSDSRSAAMTPRRSSYAEFPRVSRVKHACLTTFRRESRRAKNIRAMIRRFAAHLLGRHIPNGSHDDAGICLDASCEDFGLRFDVGGGFSELSQTEVENLYAVGAGDENIFRL